MMDSKEEKPRYDMVYWDGVRRIDEWVVRAPWPHKCPEKDICQICTGLYIKQFVE